MKTLILTVGLPRSGKSTWARKQGDPVVNPDSIRLALHGQAFLPEREPEVWNIAKLMVKSLFLAGHNTVILDATNTTKRRRWAWRSEDWKVKFEVFNTPLKLCIERAILTNKPDLVNVIIKMADNFEDIEGDER